MGKQNGQMDLNALRIFFVLYQERNMRLAAERLFSSQPAMSQHLSKLRTYFDDELFVKVPTGLEPTSFADNLYQSSYELFTQLENSIATSQAFDPSNIEHTVVLAVSPLLAPIIGHQFFKRIHELAPKLKILIHQWSKQTLDQLKSDQVQLGINYQIVSEDKQIREKRVLQDNFRCLVRKDHPHISTIITMEQAAQYPFTTIIASDWNSQLSYAEQVFAAKGFDVEVLYRSEFPASILDVVQNSDTIFPCSQLYRFTNPEVFRSIEFEGNPDVLKPSICFYHHYKNDKDPLTQWLIEVLTEVLDTP
ncbi:transcriptional regulator [Vibrio orientalis CIP 102891 = ATCC 33934]|uniref:Transcriptional regulator n=1 Tax=Vibrio orientalis CIP 102891 = ATCC 33934 TaxID=675816 RepID=C9QF24_VIBOR|nr:LysR family transcriptional regulator [Vibrio orientalis]EEX94734.1 transcriptional regulators LysR family [Vibrio orientalis CIP 102891 = ATCC 33934]EGU51433.1 transcriptional regulator [Vibrio orientalis CIP 102891 = ATCC 33934]